MNADRVGLFTNLDLCAGRSPHAVVRTRYYRLKRHVRCRQRHLDAIAPVLEIEAARARDCDRPQELSEPCRSLRHNMWFALALLLAYPRATFVGLYHYRPAGRRYEGGAA